MCVCVCVVLLPSFLPSSLSSSSEYSAKVNHKLCAVGVGLQSRLALLIFLYIHRVRLTDCLSFFIFCLFVCLCALCVPACLPAFPLLSISVLLCWHKFASLSLKSERLDKEDCLCVCVCVLHVRAHNLWTHTHKSKTYVLQLVTIHYTSTQVIKVGHFQHCSSHQTSYKFKI